MFSSMSPQVGLAGMNAMAYAGNNSVAEVSRVRLSCMAADDRRGLEFE
jgi:hypothetical protein